MVGTNARKKDREALMLERGESRLTLWDLLLLRYPLRELTERSIPADEILPELRHVLNIFHPCSRKSTFKIYEVVATAKNPS